MRRRIPDDDCSPVLIVRGASACFAAECVHLRDCPGAAYGDTRAIAWAGAIGVAEEDRAPVAVDTNLVEKGVSLPPVLQPRRDFAERRDGVEDVPAAPGDPR